MPNPPSAGLTMSSVLASLPLRTSTMAFLAPIVSDSMLPLSSSRSWFQLDHIYTTQKEDSLWCKRYKPEAKMPKDFVSLVDKDLIRSTGM